MPTEGHPGISTFRTWEATVPADSVPGPPRRVARRRPGNPLPALVLGLFVVFFVLPVLWLVLAATKTDDQLVHGNPLSFGSWHALRANWDALTSYQDDAIFQWLRNSALYSFLALVVTLAVAIPPATRWR
jgi:multiple sugar transport system permease protein